MPDAWTIAKAQAALGEIAFELLTLQERLEAMNRGLPLPRNLDAMLEGEVAPDVATEVSGCIECLVEDALRQVIEMLQHAATVTAHDLMRDFREQEKRRHMEGR